jgi:hypothetical protein
MWIRRAGLDLHGEARTAVIGRHLQDGIDTSIRPVERGEVYYRQAALPQPSDGIHKHESHYKHDTYNYKPLMMSAFPFQPALSGERP